MVESYQPDGVPDQDDLEAMLGMNTEEQQERNTNTYSKLLEKCHTCEVIDDSILLDDKARFFPTKFTNDLRSFMTTEATNITDAPFY